MVYGIKSRKKLERDVLERRDRLAVGEERLQAIEQGEVLRVNRKLQQEWLEPGIILMRASSRRLPAWGYCIQTLPVQACKLITTRD